MSKVFMDYNQQIQKLKDKGLNIPDEEYAKDILSRYSYYSLIGGYKSAFKDKSTGKYRSDVSFNDIAALYEFDESLRALFMKYLQKIERQVKSQLSFYFCEKHGENQSEYLKKTNFNYSRKNRYDVDKLVNVLTRYTTGNTDYAYINHAVTKHGNLPLWVLTNALTFGNISKFYQVLSYDLQSKVAKNYQGVNEAMLVKILIVLTGYRNACAHGERFYNYHVKQAIPDTVLHKKLSISRVNGTYQYGKQDLFAAVIAMRYMLPNDWFQSFKKELISTIQKYVKSTSCFDEKDILEFMGFPKNWKKITRYKKT